MDTISKYYLLSGILQDDVYCIAFTIRSYHKQDVSISVILKHIEGLKLAPYSDTIDLLLSLPSSAIIEASRGLVFVDEKEYTCYLVGLLDLNNVAYARFQKIGEATHIQRGLFND